MARLARWFGVVCGAATGCSLWMAIFLGGQGKESPWCERNCEPPVYSPEWVKYLFMSGVVYMFLTASVAKLAEKKKGDLPSGILVYRADQTMNSILVGGMVGVIGTPVLAALAIVLAIAYSLITG